MSQTYYPDTRASVNPAEVARVLALKKTGVSSYAGPCPRCGGTDRFWVNTSTDGGFSCRQCGDQPGFYEIVLRATGLWQERDDEYIPPPPRREAGHTCTRLCGRYKVVGNDNLVINHRQDGPNGKQCWREPSGKTPATFARIYQQEGYVSGQHRVVLCEGEKAAWAVNDAGFSSASWLGGTGGINRTDFTSFKGIPVVLWPDADVGGRKAMLTAEDKLTAAGAIVEGWVRTDGIPLNGDAADLATDDVALLIKEASTDYAPERNAKVDWPTAPDGLPVPYDEYDCAVPGHAIRMLLENTDKVMLASDGYHSMQMYIAAPGGTWRGGKCAGYALSGKTIERWAKEAERLGVFKGAVRTAYRRGTSPRGFADSISEPALAEAARQITAAGLGDRVLQCDTTKVDADPRYLGAQNGVIDLFTGDLLTGDDARDKLVSRTIPDDYIPDAEHPDAELLFAHLDPDLRSYILDAVAFSLRGAVGRRIYLLVGPKRGGKTTLLNAISYALGSRDAGYSMSIPAAALAATRMSTSNAHNAGLWGIQDCRVATVEELPGDGQRLNVGLLKSLSGGGPLSLRDVGEKAGPQRPATATIFVACNEVDADRLSLQDEAMADRARILPYPAVPAAKQDADLITRVTRDVRVRQALIAMLVRRSVKMGENAEPPQAPVSVVRATQERRNESLGEVGMWAADHLEFTGRQTDVIPAADIRAAAAAEYPPDDAKKVASGFTTIAFSRLLAGAIPQWPKAVRKMYQGKTAFCHIGVAWREPSATEIEIETETHTEELEMAITRYAVLNTNPTPGQPIVLPEQQEVEISMDEFVRRMKRDAELRATDPEGVRMFHTRPHTPALQAIKGGWKSKSDEKHDSSLPEFWDAVAEGWLADADTAADRGRPYLAAASRKEAEWAYWTARRIELTEDARAHEDGE